MHSHTIRILIPLCCITVIGASSCKKFLASYSQNTSYIESAADLDELLIGRAYYGINEYLTNDMLVAMDDDVKLGKPGGTRRISGLSAGFFSWPSDPRVDVLGKVTTTDEFFNMIYRKIAGVNTILDNIPAMREKGEPAKALNRISGEAHFLRAFYHFMLMNIYGKPYKTSTAVSDFGIPLKLDGTIRDMIVARNSAMQVYDQVISDLVEAEKELDGENINSTIRVNQATVHSLLSRVYLYMENYEKALLYAGKVISTDQYPIKDLNTHQEGKDFYHRSSSETIFTMGRNTVPYYTDLTAAKPTNKFYNASEDLLISYAPEDLRLKYFFLPRNGEFSPGKERENIHNTVDDYSELFSMRISEMYLNKAEALAGLDRYEEARSTLQELRTKRFKPADLIAINENGAALMAFIRDERRRELCFETHRWFDLRRYAVNSKYPFSKTIRHVSLAPAGNNYVVNGYYELGPYEQDEAAYTVPLPQDEIEFSKGALYNEPRPERPLKQ